MYCSGEENFNPVNRFWVWLDSVRNENGYVERGNLIDSKYLIAMKAMTFTEESVSLHAKCPSKKGLMVLTLENPVLLFSV